MHIIPAIDLLGGQVVRLIQGDMQKHTIYSDDPVDMAKQFIDMGVRRLHVVDLDGAKSGTAANYNTIQKIAALDALDIELGGGIRSMKQLDDYFSIGITFSILGTAAVKDIQFTEAALSQYPRRIILGIDARNGKVATDGWYNDSEIDAVTVALKYKNYQAESVIYTDISKDGMLGGINMEETLKFADISPFPVIASGGVSSGQDIRNLYNKKHKNIMGCIVGKAFYEGKLDLKHEISLMSAI